LDAGPSIETGASAGASWRQVAAAAGALLVGGLLASGAAWYLWPAEEPQVVTRFTFDLPPGQPFRNAGRNVIAISADGRYLACNTGAGLVLRAMDEIEARTVPGTEEPLTNPFFSPDGAWIGYWDIASGQLRKIRNSGGSPVSLAEIDNPTGATWGADDFILFGQQGGIFRVSANGGDPEKLIAADGEFLWDPQVLPDGSILFMSQRVGGTARTIYVQTPGLADRTELFSAERAIYVPTGHLVTTDAADAAGLGSLFVRSFDLDTRISGGPIPIDEGVWSSNGNTHFAVSPSGTLAFATGVGGVSAPDTVLALVDRDGIVERLNVEPSQYRGPRVSPDGTGIAVEIIGDNARSTIWIYDLSGTRAFRQLLGAGSNMRPLWTPDGERLTYASNRDGMWGIYWQAADGSGVAERITRAEEGVEHWPDSWSADRKTLAFTRIEGSLDAIASQTMWTVSLDEQGQPQEPQAFVYDEVGGGAEFSPGGKWIAYRSNAPTLTQVQVHVQPFPPTGVIHAVSNVGGSYPTWSRDGRELLYRRPAPAAGANSLLTLGIVKVASGESFAWGNETTVAIEGGIAFFGYRDYDLMPDGERLVTGVVADAAGAAADAEAGFSIQIVTNWFDLVKERAPAR
jgi:Tol biopolymer transport system component